MDRNNTFTTPSFLHHNMLIQIPDANCLKDPYPAKSTRTENHGGVPSIRVTSSGFGYEPIFFSEYCLGTYATSFFI